MTAEQEKDAVQLKKRFAELADKAYRQGIPIFTGFLSLAEQEIFRQLQEESGIAAYAMYGGQQDCERQMLCFGGQSLTGHTGAGQIPEERIEFPIECLAIRPQSEKFAQELTHRDYLGALMNLGIERSTLGDIFVQGKTGYLFCTRRIAPFIMEQLERVRNTAVKVEPAPGGELRAKEPERLEFTVSSERIDGIIARIYCLSRNQSQDLFRAGKVYVNGRETANHSHLLRDGDQVTVRGFGRFCYYGCGRENRKGRLCVAAGVYR